MASWFLLSKSKDHPASFNFLVKVNSVDLISQNEVVLSAPVVAIFAASLATVIA
jgi:hypothetical protein